MIKGNKGGGLESDPRITPADPSWLSGCQLTLIPPTLKAAMPEGGKMKEKVSLPPWLWLHPDINHSLCFSPVFIFFTPWCYVIWGFLFSSLLIQSAVIGLCPSVALTWLALLMLSQKLKLARMWQVWSDRSNYGSDLFLQLWLMSRRCNEMLKLKFCSPPSILLFAFMLTSNPGSVAM